MGAEGFVVDGELLSGVPSRGGDKPVIETDHWDAMGAAGVSAALLT